MCWSAHDSATLSLPAMPSLNPPPPPFLFFSTAGAAADDGAAEDGAPAGAMEAAIAAAINGSGGAGTVADMMGNPAIMQALQVSYACA